MSLIFTLLFIAFSITSSIAAAYIFLRFHRKALNRQYIFFGMGIFFIGIALHGIISIPILISFHGFDVVFSIHKNSGIEFTLWELLYFALAAGIGQESAKTLPILLELKRTQNKNPVAPFYWLGINIGLGFSISEIIILAVSSWQPSMPGLSWPNVFLGSFERLSGTFFHMATAGLIAFGIEKNKKIFYLISCILLHAFLDFLAGYLGKYPIISVNTEEILLFLFSFLLLILSASFIKKYSRSNNNIPY